MKLDHAGGISAISYSTFGLMWCGQDPSLCGQVSHTTQPLVSCDVARIPACVVRSHTPLNIWSRVMWPGSHLVWSGHTPLNLWSRVMCPESQLVWSDLTHHSTFGLVWCGQDPSLCGQISHTTQHLVSCDVARIPACLVSLTPIWFSSRRRTHIKHTCNSPLSVKSIINNIFQIYKFCIIYKLDFLQ